MSVMVERAIEPDPVGEHVGGPRVALAVPSGRLAGELSRRLMSSRRVVDPSDRTAGVCPPAGTPAIETLVYVPPPQRVPDLTPDLRAAARMCDACRDAGVHHLVLVSSTAVYGATPHHAGLAVETASVPGPGQPVARAWHALEALAVAALGPDHVTILRAAPAPVAGSTDYFSRLFTSAAAFPFPGHDPTLQFLTASDLARAIEYAVIRACPGTFNIVPAAPIPLRAALRLAGRRAVPVPWTVQRLLRRLGWGRGAASGSQVQFVRYHLTASGDRAARELGFRPRDTSADAIRGMQRAGPPGGRRQAPARADDFDAFGLDRAFIDASWRGLMGVLHRRYWRVEGRGFEHIPRAGGGVLVGMHRGFMPFDGVMTLHSVVQATGRVPRFLIHPGVGMRFPFLFNLMSKLGGVIACQVNADRVLESGELLGVYPEGIRGAFTMYKRAHRIGPSWRNDCVAFALRHRVPIVPFVTLGSAEIFPIVGRIDWRWWKTLTEWPFIPITTPFPLPSKWHTVFLQPMHVEREYPAAAADDPATVRAIGSELKRRMETAVSELLGRRKSIFRESLAPGGPA